MLSQLFFFLLFETVQPSYGTVAALLPGYSVANAASPQLNLPHTPIKKGGSIGPVIEAKSVYAVDLDTGTPLFVRDIFTRRPIASIAKLITAMVILDHHKLDEQLTVSANAAAQAGSKMLLRRGEKITVENALKGMLINSGNDAAVALAQFDAGSEAAFVKKMNAKAVELGLRASHFSNAKGFDEEQNYSTAFDTVLFSRAALSYPFIRATVATKKTGVSSVDGRIKHPLESTNELLNNRYFSVIGLKTGRTPAAGQSFVSFAQAPNNHQLLTVVLGSPDRFKETKTLLDWVSRNFDFP